MGTRHLPAKRVVEVALVEEAGQRVRLRELPRLAVPTRVLDRGDGALGEVFGLLDVLLGRLGIRLPPEKRERADRAELPAHERDENTAPDEVGARGFTLVPVAVADRDRPGQGTGHFGGVAVPYRTRAGKLLGGLGEGIRPPRALPRPDLGGQLRVGQDHLGPGRLGGPFQVGVEGVVVKT